MSGKHLEKSPDSLCVVNIIPPRDIWEAIQPIRNKYTANARCGPHITFIDPFVLSHQYSEAKSILEDAFAHLAPFEVKLDKLNFFKHKTSSTLFVEPSAPSGAFDELIRLAAEAFPQCRDQLDKGAGGKWVPHLSLGNFKNHAELLKVKAELEANWKPLSFTLKEVYLLNRPGPDPFEVVQVAHLGRDATAPHFGPGSVYSEEKVGRTLVVAPLPKQATNDDIILGFQSIGIRVDEVEVILNPDRSRRPVAVIQFDTREKMLSAAEAVKYSAPFPGIPAFAKPLESMAFPSIIGGCTTLL